MPPPDLATAGIAPGLDAPADPPGAGAAGDLGRLGRYLTPGRLRVAYWAALVVLVAVRVYSASVLWLDEALSVNIARLPLSQLFGALRQDGSPPFYYLLLHYWMAAFGTGTQVVRLPSVLMSLACLPVIYLIGKRLAGPSVGAAAMLILAASPFAVRYASETRMYTLVVLLVLLGVLALLRAQERPTAGRLATVSLVSGLLALTHYWALFVLAACGLYLVWRSWRHRDPVARRLLVGLLGGVVLFAPWIPSFLFQVRHTGTPWASPPHPATILTTIEQWGGTADAGTMLSALYLGLLLVAVLPWLVAGRVAAPHPRLLLMLFAAVVGSLAIGIGVSNVVRSGYALRYSAPVLPLMVLLLAVALTVLTPPVRVLALIAIAALGVASQSGVPFAKTRTQAAQTAALLRSRAQPGDLVIFCPDQLGPAVNRLLPATLRQVVYPTLGSPQRIDWVDYAARNAAANPLEVADRISAETSGHIWLVRSDGYRTFDHQCADLDGFLTALRGGRDQLQNPSTTTGEPQSVVQFPTAADAARLTGTR